MSTVSLPSTTDSPLESRDIRLFGTRNETLALTIALVGNPNAGKTSLFNVLTGLRQKVANYPGVTVERKEGVWTIPPDVSKLSKNSTGIRLIDLPGLYSLDAASIDERIARDVILGKLRDMSAPDVIVAVVDATNLERNLYLVTQLLEFGKPIVIALTMIDTLERRGLNVDAARLAETLGVAVVPVVAAKRRGIDELASAVITAATANNASPYTNPDVTKQHNATEQHSVHRIELSVTAERELAKLVSTDSVRQTCTVGGERYKAMCELYGDELPEDAERRRRITAARARLAAVNEDWWQEPLLARYTWIERAVKLAQVGKQNNGNPIPDRTSNERARSSHSTHAAPHREPTSTKAKLIARLDDLTTHRLFGPVIFLLLMLVVFQTIFSWATLPMDLIDKGFGALGDAVRAALPDGLLTALLVDGVIAGVGGVLVFLPQICLLFFFIALLEDSGYMARAAFLMDRLMRGVGLHGKAFVPLLSSFACAIPGIMATRTIEKLKDRLATIMIAPLMSCSARLPVYTLMIAAFFANGKIGFVSIGAIVIMAMYVLGIAVAIGVAWILKRTLLRAPAPPLVLEMPPYRMPRPGTVLQTVFTRAWMFVRRAGTVILAISILLWALVTFPRPAHTAPTASTSSVAATQNTSTTSTTGRVNADSDASDSRLTTRQNGASDATEINEASEALRNSFAGRMGHLIEPAIAPLGFDWQIGIGLIASFAAREVFVSTMSIVYNAGASDGDSTTLISALRAAKRADGTPAWTPLVAVSLMVFFVLACQCMSTVAIVRRETNSWRWTFFMIAYMLVLAYAASFVTYQGGRLLGFV